MIACRRIRQLTRKRPCIPFVIKTNEPLTKSEAEQVLCRVRDAARRGDPLIVGPHVHIIPLERR